MNAMIKIKQTLLERLFGIKPKTSTLTYNKITPFMRPLIQKEYNKWCKEFNVSSRTRTFLN